MNESSSFKNAELLSEVSKFNYTSEFSFNINACYSSRHCCLVLQGDGEYSIEVIYIAKFIS